MFLLRTTEGRDCGMYANPANLASALSGVNLGLYDVVHEAEIMPAAEWLPHYHADPTLGQRTRYTVITSIPLDPPFCAASIVYDSAELEATKATAEQIYSERRAGRVIVVRREPFRRPRVIMDFSQICGISRHISGGEYVGLSEDGGIVDMLNHARRQRWQPDARHAQHAHGPLTEAEQELAARIAQLDPARVAVLFAAVAA